MEKRQRAPLTMPSRDATTAMGAALAWIIVAASLPGLGFASPSADLTLQPNILLVVLDDMGWRDVGYNNGGFETPHIDRMAAEGVKLSNFYVAPTCTPTRAQLMTGRYNFRTGMQDSVIHSTEPRGVSLEETFLGEKLQSAGYATAHVGKWHLGMHMPQYTPGRRGFDATYGILTGGGDHYDHVSMSQSFTPRYGTHSMTWSGHNIFEDGVVSPDNGVPRHSTELYGAKARAYIAQMAVRPSPWFLYLAFQAVHDPIDTEPRWYTNNSCAAIVDPVVAAREAARQAAATAAAATAEAAAAEATGMRTAAAMAAAAATAATAAADAGAARLAAETGRGDESVDWDARRVLCGMMAQVDSEVGMLRAKLEALGQWDRTAVFFLSDNGGIRSHGSINLPYSGEKGSTWEGGVRVPAFVGGGLVSRALARNLLNPYTFNGIWHVTDVHATVLRLAGLAPAAPVDDETAAAGIAAVAAVAGTAVAKTAVERTASDSGGDISLDGIDQWEVLVASKRAARDNVVLHLNSANFGGSAAVRMGAYKLIRNAEPSEAAIYNKVRAAAADGPYRMSHTFFKATLETVLRQLSLATPTYLLFDLEQNPSERTDGACDDAAECTNLWGNEDFSTVQAQLLHFLHTEAAAAAESTFKWEDDGPLADPANFGNAWSPWRDEDGYPLAMYSGLAVPQASRASTATISAVSAAAGLAAKVSTAALERRASTGSGGNAGGSGGRASRVFAGGNPGVASASAAIGGAGLGLRTVGIAAVLSAAVVGAVGAVMFRLGRRSSYHSIVL